MTETDLPLGFLAGTAQAAFKNAGRPDLGLIYSQTPCQLAALFTKNIFRAAPVRIDQDILKSGRTVRAIVANSGQANSCTGQQGLENCREIQKIAASSLNIQPDEVLLLSTGVIGAQLKMDKFAVALPAANADLGNAGAEAFTRAIMTTDAFPKFAAKKLKLSEGVIHIAVMAKGAGMICPNMATMLCVVLTDAAIERTTWQDFFARVVDKTFNRVSVDGDTSTNDTILGLANGASGINANSETDVTLLENELEKILGKVARMLVKDGEGARRIMRISIKGAHNAAEAEKIARSVGNSQLVKTAIYGGDANWGRIINAIGYSGANLDPEAVSMELCGIERFRHGQPVNEDMEARLTELLQQPVIEINISVGDDDGTFTLEASDLGHEYVTLNGDYRT